MRASIILLFALCVFHISLTAQQLGLRVKVPAQDDSLGYLLYLPEEYTSSTHKWPLMIFLHGSGERGTNLELVKKNGPPMLIEQGERYPFLVVSPQCLADTRWSVPVLEQFMEFILQSCRVDTSRIYLTGLSMGGQGTWNWAMADPERFASIVPICGYADTTHVNLIKDLPVWVFHGAKDDVVPIEQSEMMVGALRRLGSDVKFTIYPEADHDSWTETYLNPELYDWMLEQRR